MFHKVFDQLSNQEDVFDNVAKPVLNSVLQGFNGTIFAYGQTGSGKTYSITGSPKNYNDRGIIPRSIQYVFAQNEKITVKPTIYISYMEIYNEIGYDLLSSRHGNTARSLEELPRIVLLEDSNGEVHMRNMSALPVATEQEAMRLLFLGDTNRTIAETPMNEYSSRSHCIFTIYITFRDEPSRVLRFSKLHLVDLAGSERVCKSLTTGTALREAKHINLSLHYLQQVILALSESKRFHIPYRNSMMTYILKDSLSGNCLTAMLATLSINKDNVQETISTCKFAQRVSLISTAPIINEIRDPQKEIAFLRSQVEELRQKVSSLSGISSDSILDKIQEERCQKEVEKYLTAPHEELKIEPSMAQIRFCFKLLKSKIQSQNLEKQQKQLECTQSQKDIIVLKDTINKQESEINTLKKIIDEIPENPINPNRFASKMNNLAIQERNSKVKMNKNVSVNYLMDTQDKCSKDKSQYHKNSSKFNTYIPEIQQDTEKQLFEIFLKNPENASNLKYYTHNLQKKLEMAKIYADTIDQCQKNITYIRQQLQTRSSYSIKNKLLMELEEQQKIYSRSLDDLKTVKNETFHLQSGLKNEEIRSMKTFKSWLESQHIMKSSESFSETDSRNSYNLEDFNCYMCSSKQDILRKPSSKQCSCDMEMEKNMSLTCCNSVHFEHPASSWTSHCNGNVCLGPICQPLIVDQHQYCDQYASCNPKSHINQNSNVSSAKLNQDQSGLFCDRRPVTSFEHVISKTKVCQSCSFIPPKKNWSTNLIKVSEKNNRDYYCRNIMSEHQEGLKYAGKEIYTDNDTETYDQSPYYENCDSIIRSLSKEPECYKCPYPSISDILEQKEDDSNGASPDNDSNNHLELVKNIQEESENVDLFKETDSTEFREFMKTVSLTGDADIDQDICNFYRNKFCS